MRGSLRGFCFLESEALDFFKHGFSVRSSLRGFCFLEKEAPGFLKHGFSVRSSLRGFCFLKKDAPPFFKAWFSCFWWTFLLSLRYLGPLMGLGLEPGPGPRGYRATFSSTFSGTSATE